MKFKSEFKILMFIVMFLALIVPSIVVYAQGDSDYVVMPSKSNIAIDRVFNIKFNYALDENTVTKDNIIVKDATGKLVDVSLKLQENDKSIIEVKPLNNYGYSQKYTLSINVNMKSVDGKKMNKPVKLDFSIKANSGEINTPINTLPTTTGSSFTVCLDAGHGGTDSGLVSSTGVREKDVDLKVVLKVGKLLEQSGINVIYTRKTDSTLDMQGRINLAAKANYFISVHGNKADNASAVGIETYYDAQNGKGQALATTVQDGIVKQTAASDRGIKTSTNAMQEVFNASVPSIKLYLGFFSNDSEVNLLASDDYENKLAQGIASGVINIKKSDVSTTPSTNPTIPNQANSKYTIVLDAGHGGYDSGAVGPSGIQEKAVNLAVTLKVGALLTQKGITVVYTRTSDDVSWTNDINNDLQTRCDISNKVKPNYFVCIHANSAVPEANGIETYYYDGNTDGQKLASNIQKELISAVGLQDRGIKTAGFYVLKYTDAPAILTELGFISNPTEESLLNSEDYQDKCANAIVKGITETLGL